LAQVERRELPVLQGEPASSKDSKGTADAPVQISPPLLSPPPPSLARDIGRAPAGSTLPRDLWRGLDAAAMERLLGGLPLPSPSPTLARLIATTLATGATGESQDLAVRIAALERAGRVEELLELLRGPAAEGEPGGSPTYALALLAQGRSDEACAIDVKPTAAEGNGGARRAAFLIPAYCALAGGDKQGAALALSVARDNGVDAGPAGAAVAKLAKSSTRLIALPKRIDLLDYLFLEPEGSGGSAEIAAKATPELLFRLARDDQTRAELRLAAAERAAALNVIDGQALGEAYREIAPKLAKSGQSPAALRAKLFGSLDGPIAGKMRADSIDALLASARDARIELPMAEALAEASSSLEQDAQAARFAETGVRIAALAGDADAAWAWAEREPARSWQLLLAATDPSSERAQAALGAGVEIALKAELPGALLQRLVTVLDALGEEVPIPLWELAGKTPQPEDGHLPETGVLTSLKEAADAGEVGRTVLLVASALGPDGPQGVHLIALSDALRALKRVGLDAEAKRLALEALYRHWPSRGKV
jgi:hypothetical protein